MLPVWVIGAGGLLGKAVVEQAAREKRAVFSPHICWADSAEATNNLAAGIKNFAAHNPSPTIIWCAGAGVPSTPKEAFDAEVKVFRSFLKDLRKLPQAQLSHLKIFFASSAGAVYSGAGKPPYTETSPTLPLAPYGHAKLKMESLLTTFASNSDARVICGRISNLYGPGQNLTKSQGLISVLLMGYLTRNPVQIYVSLDTIRDYLFSADAAALIFASLRRLAAEPAGTTVTKIFCSGQATTISSLLGLTRQVIGHKPRMVQGASAFANVQTRDLSMRSHIWPELGARAFVPLLDGIGRTWIDLIRRHNSASA